jgi:hypothetical protein
MNKYQTRYLIILDELAVFPPYARKMVADIPELFRMVFEVKGEKMSPGAAIYEVDLNKLAVHLNLVSEKK